MVVTVQLRPAEEVCQHVVDARPMLGADVEVVA
jgi:hypothetical protein